MRVSILLMGNVDRAEFHQARAVLDSWGRVVEVADVQSAATAINHGAIVPDVIVVAQSYPAQFSHGEIDRLRRLAPLARVLGLMGSWCEGEMRTGKPWPAAIRIYWHQWPPRCHLQLQRLQQGRCTEWGLPITATEEERLLLSAEPRAADRQGLIAIHTSSSIMEDWLSAALRGRGYSTVWLRPPRLARVEGAAAAIFDGSHCRCREFDELKLLSATLTSAPIVALLDFPRIDDHRRALSAGAVAVLSKPLHIDDLYWQLDRVLDEDRPM